MNAAPDRRSLDRLKAIPAAASVVVAFAVVAVATLVRLFWLEALGARATYVLFYPAVTLAALYGGLPAGLLATILSGLAADYFWIAPAGFGITDPADWLSMAIFLAGGVFISGVAEAMHRAQTRARAAEAEASRAAERERSAEQLRDLSQRAEEALQRSKDELEQRVAERTTELRASSRYSRSLLEASLDPLVTISPDGQITDVNRATELVTGVDRDRLVGHDFSAYFTEPEKADAGYEKVLAEGFVRDYPLTIRHVSGHTSDVLYNAVVYRNEAGEVIGVFAAARDVTERKRAETELARYRDQLEELVRQRTAELESTNTRLQQEILERGRAEDQLRLQFTVLQSTANGLVITGRDGTIQWVNAAFTQLTGYTAAEAVGRNPRVVNSGQQDAAFFQEMWQTIVAGRVWHGELVNKRKDGSLYTEEMTITPVTSTDGKITHFVAVKQDITARRRADVALQRAAAELTRSNEELQQFAYVASHDLQEPLRAVAGYVHLIETRFADQFDDKGRQHIAGAVQGAVRMHKLITDLLELSRVGTRTRTLEPTDLNAVLAQVLHSLDAAIGETGARITVDPLPTLRADASQLAQLFQNLLGNALKFRGAEPLAIHVGAQRQNDGQWRFGVRDNGIGIDPQYFERIFLIFQRLHTRKEYAGTGIGLAICKKIVERHGGRIWVESQPGRGSIFYFTLPGPNNL
jgi:PAS domain S-box-containing protein